MSGRRHVARDREPIAPSIARELTLCHDELRADIARGRDALADAEQIARRIDRLIVTLGGTVRGTGPMRRSRATTPSDPNVTRRRTREMAEAARRVLIENGGPLLRGGVAARLIDKGVVIKAKDPASYIGTLMSRWHEMFVLKPGKGFWIREGSEADDSQT